MRWRRNYCDLRCLPLSKTIGGDANVDHSQFIVGDAVKSLGGYIPPSLPGFRHPCLPHHIFKTASFVTVVHIAYRCNCNQGLRKGVQEAH